MVGAQLAFTYLPLFNRLFETEPMRIEAWGFVLGLAVAIFLVVGMEKWIRARVISRAGPRAAASA